MSFKGLLFDMDGVLFDSEPIHIDAWHQVLKKAGVDNPPDFTKWVGTSDKQVVIELMDELGLEAEPKAFLEEKRGVYKALSLEALPLYPGVLEEIRGLSFPMGMVTSSHREECDDLLEKSGLLPFFRSVVTSSDVTEIKPAPEPYEKGARGLSLEPGECVVIEDSSVGVSAARNAGCRVLAVTNTTQKEELAHADEIFPSTLKALERAKELIQA